MNRFDKSAANGRQVFSQVEVVPDLPMYGCSGSCWPQQCCRKCGPSASQEDNSCHTWCCKTQNTC